MRRKDFLVRHLPFRKLSGFQFGHPSTYGHSRQNASLRKHEAYHEQKHQARDARTKCRTLSWISLPIARQGFTREAGSCASDKKSVDLLFMASFWHQHTECPEGRFPKSRRQYWIPKLNRNVERDQSHLDTLQTLGWRVLVLWECELGVRI